MDQGTNQELFGKKGTLRAPKTSKAGRPKINRDLAIKNLKAKDSLGNLRYTKAQVARLMKCTPKTINRIYNEAVEKGIIDPDEVAKAIGMIEADFDAECERAKGSSFRQWILTKFDSESAGTTIFNFCSKVWEQTFSKCDLVEFADEGSFLGERLTLDYVTLIQKDKKRSRARLKHIRFLYRFLNRRDLMDKHLTMSNSKNPRSVRRVPVISQTNFGLLYTEAEDRLRSVLGNDAVTDLRLKIVTQMRTGNKGKEREFYGIQKGTKSKSYLSMVSPDEYQFHVFAKKAEQWDVIWMPKEVKEAVFKRHEEMDPGDNFASVSVTKFRRVWGDATEDIMEDRLILHDLRKISLTWLYVMGVPLEVACMLNVGWKDLSTAHSHYIDIKKILRKSFRTEYRKNIPDWFKEGLEDFTGFEAVIDGGPGGPSALGAIQGTGHFGGR